MAQKFAKDPDPTVTRLIDEGHKLVEEYNDVLERRENTRNALRTLVGAGMATKEQAGLVDELYPKRARKTKDDNNNDAQASETAAQAA